MAEYLDPLQPPPFARQNASRTLKRMLEHIRTSSPDRQPPPLRPRPSPSSSSSQELADEEHAPVRGMLQEMRNFLSLSRSSEPAADEPAVSGGDIPISLRLSLDANVHVNSSAFRPVKQQSKGSSLFEFERRANAPVRNGRSISPEPFKFPGVTDRATLDQPAQEHVTDRLKGRDGSGSHSAFQKASSTDEAVPFRCALPAIPQKSNASARSQSCGNGSFWHQSAQAPSRPPSSGASRIQPTAQLTIFYAGTVNVYDEVPADKAHAIMLLAGSGNGRSFQTMSNASSMAVYSSGTVASTAPIASGGGLPTPAMRESMMVPFTGSSAFSADGKPQLVKRSHTELPFATKASLARFLERRRDSRVQAKAAEAALKLVNEREDNLRSTEQQQEVSPYIKRLCSNPPSPCNDDRSSAYQSTVPTPSTPPMTPQRIA